MGMLAPSDSSATLPPARPVFVRIRNKRSSQAMRTGVAVPTYTIKHDPPWLTTADQRNSDAPPPAGDGMSPYSEDYDHAYLSHRSSSSNDRPPDAPPRTSSKPESHRPSHMSGYHAQPRQQLADPGPQTRGSRLPIFQQVRSLLHKPVSVTAPMPRREGSAGKALPLSPAADPGSGTRVSPAEPLRDPVSGTQDRYQAGSRGPSPVSLLLRDDEEEAMRMEVKPPPPLKISRPNIDTNFHPPLRRTSPVSPISPVSPLDEDYNTQRSEFIERALPLPPPPATASARLIKRKPTPSSLILDSNPTPQRSPSITSTWTSPPHSPLAPATSPHSPQRDSPAAPHSASHFSWTTYAPSVVAPGGRRSTDSNATRHMRQPSAQDSQGQGQSRQSHFSWSTVATGATYPARPDSPPPSPPPMIPAKYGGPAQPGSPRQYDYASTSPASAATPTPMVLRPGAPPGDHRYAPYQSPSLAQDADRTPVPGGGYQQDSSGIMAAVAKQGWRGKVSRPAPTSSPAPPRNDPTPQPRTDDRDAAGRPIPPVKANSPAPYGRSLAPNTTISAHSPAPPEAQQRPRGPNYESILSRQRPVQRQGKQDWGTPPPRTSSATSRAATHAGAATTVGIGVGVATTAPKAVGVHPALRRPSPPLLPSTTPSTHTSTSTCTSTSTDLATKALPPPPASHPTPTAGPGTTPEPPTHLLTLQTTEHDLHHQHTAIARAIADLESVLRASPLDVGWSTIKTTEVKLGVMRERLEEIVLREREVGIGIARLRRREEEREGGGGGGEGLWVRRVTG
ncbi:hypothetical protein LTR53_013693 [Teratosphaeriaceae sp. CCFEE 6253]|nr:hypothetical protein LTR53_013693 [Teratosphaeriaceae sp. CCFEE 6253]